MKARGCVVVLLVVSTVGAVQASTGVGRVPAPPRTVAQALRPVSAPPAELRLERTIELPNGTRVLRYHQEVGGVRVLRAEAIVLDLAAGPPMLVADTTRPQIDDPAQARVSRAEAIATAVGATGASRLRAPADAELVIQPGDGGRLAWRVQVDSARPPVPYEVTVDARSGATLGVRDAGREASGRARIYLPNPVVQNGGPAGLSDRRNRNSSLLTALRRDVVLSNLGRRNDCLKGAFVEVRDRYGPVCKRRRRFTGVKRDDTRFEALMAYYHVDRTQAYISSLNVGSINHRRQRVLVDAFKKDNSEYDPWDRTIRYGSGGVDDAEDADVIVHEYAHAVQDAQVRGFGQGDAEAVGEGFGDYLAAVMSSQQPGSNPASDACMFEWDIAPYGVLCARQTDHDPFSISDANLTPGCAADSHCVGMVWSGALWSLRTDPSIPPDGSGFNPIDRDVLFSHFMLPTNASLAVAGDALVAADQALHGGANQVAIDVELTARGI